MRELAPEANAGIHAVPQLLTRRTADFLWSAKALADMGHVINDAERTWGLMNMVGWDRRTNTIGAGSDPRPSKLEIRGRRSGLTSSPSRP